jgi:SH3-like domain-containing protein
MLRIILILFSLIFYEFNVFAQDEYFLTLRNERVNLRQGPSFDYPIKIFYKKKYLPVIIQDKSSNFRKIRDHENNSGWIHISQLSKKRAAITVDANVMVFKKPTFFSKPQVLLDKGRLCLITKCKNDWCKIKVEKFTGWIKKESLWGRLKN